MCRHADLGHSSPLSHGLSDRVPATNDSDQLPVNDLGAGRWILYFPIYLVLLQFKIHTEERLMLAEFPDDYLRYRQRVPQLVPGLRLIGGHKATSS